MKKALLVAPHHLLDRVYGPEERSRLEQLATLIHPPLSTDELLASPGLLREADCLFSTWGAPKLDAFLLDHAPNLQAFFYAAGSVKGFVSDAFWERSITLCSAWAMNAIPVAEFTFAQIILSLKRTWLFMQHSRDTKDHGHDLKEQNPVPGTYGSSIGLISCGQIGRLVVQRLKTLDVHILVYDPFLTNEQADEIGVEPVGLKELFERSDVVSCHTPWLKETEKMLQREHFAAMKHGATFINTARGAVVDEEALASVLVERPDLYALLDVTYPEPPRPDHPFYSLRNILMTPHIAGSMNNECRRMANAMMDEFVRWESGQPLRWQITQAKAAILA